MTADFLTIVSGVCTLLLAWALHDVLQQTIRNYNAIRVLYETLIELIEKLTDEDSEEADG